MKIKVNSTDSIPKDTKTLITKILKHLKPKIKFKEEYLSINFIKPSEIKTMNSQYRKKDQATDVLTFPIFEDGIIGDIYVCLEEVLKKAQNYKINEDDQLALTIAHAFAHLAGYNHEEEAETTIMERFEDDLLNGF